MRRLASFMIVVLLTLATIVGSGYWGYQQWLKRPTPTPVAVAAAQSLTTLAVTLIQGQASNRQITKCQGSTCQLEAVPSSVKADGMFDGQAWYYYDDVESQNTKTQKHILLRTQADTGQTTQLIEQTPLTMPRDIIMSPNGKYVAFWLDNIDQPTAKLTELWVYDVDQGGIRLLAEHLYAPDIRSRVRWNSASTYVSFMVDTGPQTAKTDQLALAVVPVQSSKIQTQFNQIDWSTMEGIVQAGLFDLSPDGKNLAYVQVDQAGTSELVLTKAENKPDVTTIRGRIAYMQWLEDGSLIYAVQDETGSTFWRTTGGAHRFVARQPGQLQIARAAGSGDYIALLVKNQSQYALYSMAIKNGLLKQLTVFPRLLSPVGMLQVAVIDTGSTTRVAGAISQTSDNELIGFIEKNLPSIVQQPNAQAQRILVANQPATAYVEYQDQQNQPARILLTIFEFTNADWVIKAHYAAVGASWQKVQGGGLADPEPTRLYEWEPSVQQWILKQQFNSGQSGGNTLESSPR